jgi:hypothetical protein
VVQPTNPSEQTPTAALVSGSDPVSEAQKALDGEGGAAQPDYVGKSQFDALQQQFAEQGAQLRGLQGALDRSTKSSSDQAAASQKAEHEAWIAEQPEDSRVMLEYLHRENVETNKRIDALGQSSQAPAGPDEAAKNFVREAGVSPEDPRINYALYDGTDKGTWAFIDNITAAKGAPAQVVPATVGGPAPQQQAAPPVTNPPGPSDSPQSQGGLATEDDIISWGITTGNFVEADQKLKAAGFRGLN